MQTKTTERSQTGKNNLRVQGTEVRVEAVDLSEISDGKLTKKMLPKRNLGNVYTLCMRVEKKHQGELHTMKFRGSNIFNKKEMTNCIVPYNEVKEGNKKETAGLTIRKTLLRD